MTLAQRRIQTMRDAYLFIVSGGQNAASLAGKLGVSVPTASRLVEALKKDLGRRGKHLVSVRSEAGFHYEVQDDERPRRVERDPLVTLTIPARGRRRKGMKAEDRQVYDRD
jgi:hypothetical protein